MQPVIIVHHHEITLKGDNRGFFEKQLRRNVRLAIADLVPSSTVVSGGYGRFVIDLPSNISIEVIADRLTTVFGLSNVCIGVRVQQDVEEFTGAAGQLLEGETFRTIRVDTRRPDKNFPVRSMEVNARVGEYLCKRFGVRANLTAPDETIFIEIVNGAAYVYRSKLKGAGGLPVGASGRVVSLISAGFDSPVASWMLMKRGGTVVFVHFHSMPYTSERSIDQVRQLVESLTRYQFSSKLYLVPFAEIQQEIVLQSPQPLRVILYRRMMLRIAESLAHREKAEALVTGESVGQVASQTLRNIRAINAVATLPVLRPLSGTDKEETIAVARMIGTYDISKEPYDDCCSFLAPRKPETWATIEEVENAEKKLDIHSIITRALGRVTLEHFSFPHVTETNALELQPN
ncbi:MAG: tRNA 4-thiouridine(8) synthase ThiI [Ignavibacteriae bacterium]|nr:tRNA 4-thiouridine(8) synthase ThiI [Ignavibacteria bacterium]MBI3364191.1 tRNA 4-thiouridine(8) synthase ThiI [Ignavibacteriota bacterium]